MRTIYALFLLLLSLLLPVSTQAEEVLRQVRGVVCDAETGAPLSHVAVSILGTNIGTVTNADGRFVLKATEPELAHGVKCSHVGYLNLMLSKGQMDRAAGELQLQMKAVSLHMGEVTIYGGTGRELVEAAIRNIAVNYSDRETLFEAFHRETVQKRRNYIAVSEAVMDLYKTSYARRDIHSDKVRLTRGRRVKHLQLSDTLAVKIVGGPAMALVLDVVKNGEEVLGEESLDEYEFRMVAPVSIDNRAQHVIQLMPRVVREYALFHGTLYIDQERLSFTRIELSLDQSDPDKASRVMLRQRPPGLRFRPMELAFVITYRMQGERVHLNYVRSTFRFKCDWKRRLFSAPYTAVSESVMVNREEEPRVIRYKEAFRAHDIFYDEVEAYADPDYWRDYTIIEPSESLEKAVARLRKQHK